MISNYGGYADTLMAVPTVSEMQPEVPDYLVTVCAVCLRPGDVIPVHLGCMITYTHDGCRAAVDNTPDK